MKKQLKIRSRFLVIHKKRVLVRSKTRVRVILQLSFIPARQPRDVINMTAYRNPNWHSRGERYGDGEKRLMLETRTLKLYQRFSKFRTDL